MKDGIRRYECQSPVFFCFFLAGSSASPFAALVTGFGFGFGLGAGFSGSESTSIGSSASPPFDFDTGFAALGFLGLLLLLLRRRRHRHLCQTPPFSFSWGFLVAFLGGGRFRLCHLLFRSPL